MNTKSKYITFFDLETTGLDKTKDQIIQIACIKVNAETLDIVSTFERYIQPIGNYSIGLGAYFKHGIKPEFLADKPYLKDIAQEIVEYFGNDDVAGYNSNRFDIPFLKYELNKYGYDIDFTKRNCYDVFKTEQRRHGNNLDSVFKRYYGHTMIEEGLEAHNAFSDVKATISILKKQNETEEVTPEQMYGEDGVLEAAEFMGEIKPCFTLGKYRQLSVDFVSTIDQNYLQWCISDKCGFGNSTKEFIKQYIK